MGDRRLPADRRRQIKALLLANSALWTSALSELLDASPSTIRRDLQWLEDHGEIERTHGGAIPTQRALDVPPFSSRSRSYSEEKRSIAIAAAAMVQNGDILFLNMGTTAALVARELLLRPSLAGLVIVTDSLFVALELQESSFEVVLLGGSLRPHTRAFVGMNALHQLGNVYASKCVLGVSGMSAKYGLTQPYHEEATIDRLMIRQTRGPIIVVSDHSKWGVVSNFKISNIDQVDTLITDAGLPDAAKAEFAAHSVEVIIRGPD